MGDLVRDEWCWSCPIVSTFGERPREVRGVGAGPNRVRGSRFEFLSKSGQGVEGRFGPWLSLGAKSYLRIGTGVLRSVHCVSKGARPPRVLPEGLACTPTGMVTVATQVEMGVSPGNRAASAHQGSRAAIAHLILAARNSAPPGAKRKHCDRPRCRASHRKVGGKGSQVTHQVQNCCAATGDTAPRRKGASRREVAHTRVPPRHGPDYCVRTLCHWGRDCPPHPPNPKKTRSDRW